MINQPQLHQAESASGPAKSLTKCLGVVIPIFNEERTVDEILRRVLSQPVVKEVVVVDDASTDGTWERLQSWPKRDDRVKLLRHDCNRGKGAALRTGFDCVQSPIVVVQDGDLEYDPADFSRMLALFIEKKADVVYGSRYAGGDPSAALVWHTFGNKLLTLISNLASHSWLTDEATCYKMFRREILGRIKLEEEGFGFCPEFTAKIRKLGIRIHEVPISYRGRTRSEGKKIRLWDGAEALRCIFKYNVFL